MKQFPLFRGHSQDYYTFTDTDGKQKGFYQFPCFRYSLDSVFKWRVLVMGAGRVGSRPLRRARFMPHAVRVIAPSVRPTRQVWRHVQLPERIVPARLVPCLQPRPLRPHAPDGHPAGSRPFLWLPMCRARQGPVWAGWARQVHGMHVPIVRRQLAAWRSAAWQMVPGSGGRGCWPACLSAAACCRLMPLSTNSCGDLAASFHACFPPRDAWGTCKPGETLVALDALPWSPDPYALCGEPGSAGDREGGEEVALVYVDVAVVICWRIRPAPAVTVQALHRRASPPLSVCLSVCYTHKEQMNATGPAVVQQLER